MKILYLPGLLLCCLLLISCGTQAQKGEDSGLFPTPPVVVEPTGALEESIVQADEANFVELTPTPNIADWVIGSVVEDWQKPAINAVVQAYWSYRYHPDAGQPNCAAAAALVNSPDKDLQSRILDHCNQFAQAKFFVSALPLAQHSANYVVVDELQGTSSQFRGVVVELDTGAPWTGQTFYFPDGGFYGTTQEPHTIWRISLRIEDGQWWVYATSRETRGQ